MERDRQGISVDEKIVNFNSHAHVERDILSKASKDSSYDFNSHAHVERDTHE